MKSDDCRLGICIMVGLAAENIPAFCPDDCPLVELNRKVDELNLDKGEAILMYNEVKVEIAENQAEITKLWLHLSTLCDYAEWNRRDITASEREIAELKTQLKSLTQNKVDPIGY